MLEVARVRTPITVAVASSSLLAALRAAGHEPHRAEAELLLAQLWLETARGSACDNHNPGNITAGPKWQGDFFRPAWFTVDASSSPQLQRLHALMLKGEAPSAFRSYADFDHGFGDYVSQLVHTFPSLLIAARSGDPDAFGATIKTSGYAPDAPAGTGKSIASLQREFRSAGVFSTLPLDPPAAAQGRPCSS